MDIKTADRLQELRKQHGLSQEALSEKLGVSRQAISKWERGESSPDTDNLITLANIYGITLDDILNPEKKIEPIDKKEEKKETEEEPKPKKKGIHSSLGKSLLIFPLPLVIIGAYVLINLKLNLWHPTWLLFTLIPIYYHFAGACYTKTKRGFLFALPIPELVILAYLLLGFTLGIWGAGAIVFIIIPIYYWGVAFYKS